MVAFFFFSAHAAAFAAAFALASPPVGALLELFERIADVSFSKAAALFFMRVSTCLAWESVSVATNSHVVVAISSTMLLIDACPVARAVVASCRLSLVNSVFMTVLRLAYICAAIGLTSPLRIAAS